jgi:hypothetical protein
MGGPVARLRELRNEYRIIVGKPEVKSPHGRPRLRWEDNIKIDPKRNRVGLCGLAGSWEFGNEPLGSIRARHFLNS